MSTEEVFIVHYTLKLFNINYDEIDNPKKHMVEGLKNSNIDVVSKEVYKELKNIPNGLMKGQIIEYLYKIFINNNPDKANEYSNLKENELYYYFENDDKFGKQLLSSYYKYNSWYVININNRLHDDIKFIVDDFKRIGTPEEDIIDTLKDIIIDGAPFTPDKSIKCNEAINEISYYRNYLSCLIISEIYENILARENETVGKVESTLINMNFDYDEEFYETDDFMDEEDEQWEDSELSNDYDSFEDEQEEEYEEFNNIIKLLVRNNGINIYLPNNFYRVMIQEYFEIIQDNSLLQSNRENMTKNHVRTLSKINPLYIFDNM